MSVWYGDLDRALTSLKGERWAPVAMAGYFASVPAGWAGGIVGPSVLSASRFRRPVLAAVLLGGALGSGIGALVGTTTGWVIWREGPRSRLVVWVPMSSGVVIGTAAGWIAGRFVTAPARGGL